MQQLPTVKLETIESIVDEVFAKNETFGVQEFMSRMETDNRDMCIVLYSFIEAVADSLSQYNDVQKEEFCALAKMSTHLLYKGLTKQIEINNDK